MVATPIDSRAAGEPTSAAPQTRRQIALLCALFFLLELAILSFRISQAPDLFADEAFYTSIGNNIAAGRGLVENTGITFVWHPPLFPLIAAGYLKLTGLVDADPIVQIYALRQMNAIAGALTAALLFAIGWRTRGRLCSIAVALLFCLDPYVQRINRRTMLETVAALLLIVGVWFFLRGLNERRHGARYAVATGVAIALAALVKEFMLFGLLVMLIFAALYRRDQIKRVGLASITALLVYGLYPLWIFFIGAWPAYAEMKTRQLFRLFSGLVKHAPAAAAPVNAPRISLWENVTATMLPYAFSYMMIAAGSLLALIIIGRSLIRRRHVREDIALVALWVLIADLLIGTSMVFGQGSDQFFYLVSVPVIILVGAALAAGAARMFDAGGQTQAADAQLRAPDTRLRPRWTMSRALALGVLLVGACWNIGTYVKVFVLSQDNGYAQVQSYVRQNVPLGATLEVGNELGNYIFPGYNVRFDRSPDLLHENGARYVILSTKERWGGYNSVSHDFYDWVAANSVVRFEHEGPTFWNVRLFELTTPEAKKP